MNLLDNIKRTRGPVPCPICKDPMVETDAPGVYECNCGTEAALDGTFHATVDRWAARSDDPSTGVLTAWSDGIVLDAHDQDEHNLVADEIRYHHETTTVILRKDIGLVTAIDYRTARDGIQRAVIRTLLEHEVDRSTIAEAVNIAGLEQDEFRSITREVNNARSDQGNSPAFGGTDTPGRIKP